MRRQSWFRPSAVGTNPRSAAAPRPAHDRSFMASLLIGRTPGEPSPGAQVSGSRGRGPGHHFASGLDATHKLPYVVVARRATCNAHTLFKQLAGEVALAHEDRVNLRIRVTSPRAASRRNTSDIALRNWCAASNSLAADLIGSSAPIPAIARFCTPTNRSRSPRDQVTKSVDLLRTRLIVGS